MPNRALLPRLPVSSLSAVLASVAMASCGGGGGESPAAGAAGVSGVVAQAGISTAASALRDLADSSTSTKAAGYYIDSNAGSDDNPGTMDQPWRTLARAASVRLRPGEGLYLHCTGTWRESLVLGADQLVDGSVVAGYGTACTTRKAVISAADDFSGGWVLENGVWARSLPIGTPKVTQLFLNGQPLRTAQWPNESSVGVAGAATVKTASTAAGSAKQAFVAQAADMSSLAKLDLSGATVQIRTQPWLIESRQIASYAMDTVLLDRATNWPILGGQGLIFQDKRWMLDQPGEYFHDLTAQRLYLIAPAAMSSPNLNNLQVEGSVRDVALLIAQRKNVTLRDIALRAARDAALVISEAPASKIQQIEASHSAMAGIRMLDASSLSATSDSHSVTDSLLDGNGLYGLDAANSTGIVFARNTVRNTGNGWHQVANTIAAIATGPGGRVEDNLVEGAGYVGINFSAQGGSLVKGNSVTGHCTRLIDCAGIYTYTGRARNQPGQTSTVIGNRVYGGPDASAETAPSSELIVGIYVDDYSDGVTVADNLVFDTPIGVFVHNSSRVSVRNNRLWLVKRTGIWANMDQTDGDWMRLNVFEGNQIVPVVQAQASDGALPNFTAAHAIWFWHSIDGTAALSSLRNLFRDNTVVELQGALAVHAWVHGGGSADTIGATRWLKLNPGDKQPSRPARFKPLIPTLGPEQIVDSGFDLGLAQWSTWRAPGSTLFSAVDLPRRDGCAEGCVSFTAGTTGDLLASKPFILKEQVPYLYRVTLATDSTSGAGLGSPYISRDTTPWDAMANGQGYRSFLSLNLAAGERLEYESYFIPKAVAPARVNLQLETTGVDVSVDMVSVREVLGYQTSATKNWARIVLAPQHSSRVLVVDCSDLGWPAGCTAIGLDGAQVPLPLAVGPGTERMLLRADSPFRH
jgi:hypothetical protein